MRDTTDSTLEGLLPMISEKLDALSEQTNTLVQKAELHDAILVELAKLVTSLHNISSSIPKAITDAVTFQISEHINSIRPDLHAIKQITNMNLRETGVRCDQVRCVFIVQSIPMWDALAELYWAMMEDPRFHPMVISIDHSHLGMAAFAGETEVHEALGRMQIPHLRLNVNTYDALDILRNLQPHVIFRQQQWDLCVPPGLRTEEITFARICVVPYGMGVLADPNENERDPSDDAYALNYDQKYHQLAWKVFCETELTQSYYRSFQHSDPEKFILSGYPKFDRLEKSNGKGVWPLPEPNGKTFRIIWAPHHSLGGFGVFHKIYKQMLAWARKSKDIQFILKPHPVLSTSVTYVKSLGQKEYYRFLEEWSSLPNCGVCEGEYGELFASSDLMITDGVSFLTEYPLFGKPLIYFDSRTHHPFNALGRLAEDCAHKVYDFGSMQKTAESYKNGASWPYEEERQKLLKVMRPCEESASKIILNSIAEDILS